MIRHISIFFFKEGIADFEKNRVCHIFKEMKKELSYIADYQVGSDCMPRPPKGIPGLPEFGHLVQVIDFLTEEAAAGYAMHPAHIKVSEAVDSYIEKVVAIDFEV